MSSLDDDLNLQKTAVTGPVENSVSCLPPMSQCTAPLTPQDNANKVLLIDYHGGYLIVCGTVYLGYCERRNLTNITAVAQADKSYQSRAVVTNSPEASVAAFLAPGPEQYHDTDVLYVGASYPGYSSLVDPPAVASRKLDDFELTHRELIKFTQTAFRMDQMMRQAFPIDYVYGFTSENFSYLMTVQKTAPNLDKYHSVLVRVCHDDVNFYSYIEVPFACSDSNGLVYNILQAAALGQASDPLARQMGIVAGEGSGHVLYATFAVSKSSFTLEPSTQQVMCVFPMHSVRTRLTENIQLCFMGNGTMGGGHLRGAQNCKYNTVREEPRHSTVAHNQC